MPCRVVVGLALVASTASAWRIDQPPWWMANMVLPSASMDKDLPTADNGQAMWSGISPGMARPNFNYGAASRSIGPQAPVQGMAGGAYGMSFGQPAFNNPSNVVASNSAFTPSPANPGMNAQTPTFSSYGAMPAVGSAPMM